MDYLQYYNRNKDIIKETLLVCVLNLVINGLPSILDKYNKETGVSYVF